jgi:two-component system, chemotaxis family, protein-glutamate methylesterase/glutaminase
LAINDRNPVVTGGRASNGPIKIMLVDDSAVIRGLINRMITPESDMEVVASVQDGQRAVETLTRNPSIDVILLDIEMPVMDGLTALPKLIAVKKDVKIVMASTLTLENAEVSMKAMKLGALDYVPKPTSTREIGGASDFRQELLGKVRAVMGRVAPSAASAASAAPATAGASPTKGAEAAAKKSLYAAPVHLRDAPKMLRKPEIVAIGSSTGGPQALFEVLKHLRPDMRLPIVVTQHMPRTFTTILAQHMAQASGRQCAEARDGEPLVPGRIYVAPGDFHMLIEGRGKTKTIRLNQDPPENFCRPAVDPMFRSIAQAYGERVLAVVLTGMGSDGCKGGVDIVNAGGVIVAQDEASSVVWGMPGAAATAGLCTELLPLNKVAGYINDFVAKGMP